MGLIAALSLVVGLCLSACGDSGGPSEGALVVSTSTDGGNPDRDGYLLTVDGVGSFNLAPAGTFELNLSSGRYGLTLLGVADQCSVAPTAAVEVEVAPRGTTPVAFEVTCSATGASVKVTTTGADIDPDGYRLLVDDSDRGTIASNGTVLSILDPGSRTITLTGLTPNCAIQGSASRTVTVVATEVAPVEFAVECIAISGVIRIVISGGSFDGTPFSAILDGATRVAVGYEHPAQFLGVPPGDHVVSLSTPDLCTIDPREQLVTVTIGTPIRETVQVTFSVICMARLRISVPTTGTIPGKTFKVFTCAGHDCFYNGFGHFIGTVEPNGTLIVEHEVGTYHVRMDLPPKCIPGFDSFNETFTAAPGESLDLVLPVTCSV